jgi:hypothetical protein
MLVGMAILTALLAKPKLRSVGVNDAELAEARGQAAPKSFSRSEE